MGPGSDIIVILGIIEGYLRFFPIMLSLITAICVILNPVIAGANVTADSALVIMFAKFHKKFFVKGKQVALK
ncbi:hypothetical protein EJB10_01470 [Wolbachia endosymbiont of Brugia malayi]|uniref:hypothetical protein n=1 Tax=Wolbachia endosymbiont of Brugia malayi TaxID=80849 RepID=UPI0006835A9F|nr:hypothetical protein [Wolbachia endosymbiont of Brugia malayi]QCB61506.1 hypothetical protein EJB10_01470 [Wolbachia endosymbiont of Brugia malayi]